MYLQLKIIMFLDSGPALWPLTFDLQSYLQVVDQMVPINVDPAAVSITVDEGKT